MGQNEGPMDPQNCHLSVIQSRVRHVPGLGARAALHFGLDQFQPSKVGSKGKGMDLEWILLVDSRYIVHIFQ